MKPPDDFIRIIKKKRYSVKAATLLAGNDFWDGHNYERKGRNTFLYVSPRGQYFTLSLSQWQGEKTALELVTPEEAIGLFESVLSEHRVKYAEAFPDVNIEDG